MVVHQRALRVERRTIAGRLVGLAVVMVAAFALLSGTALAADPEYQFQSISPQQQGSTLQQQLIVKFWSSHNSADSAPSGTINWGDGSTPDPVQANSQAPANCTNTPDGATLGSCPAHQGFEYDVTAGPHTFQANGPYTVNVNLTGFDQANGSSPFQLDATGTIASSVCNTTATLGYAQLRLLGSGCINSNGSQQTTPAGVPALVNGLELHPASGVSLTLDSATGMLSSAGGDVTVAVGEAALGQRQVSFKPAPLSWRVSPNPGETTIDEGSAGRFAIPLGGSLLGLPAFSDNGIKLGNGQSDTDFSVGVPLPPRIISFFGVVEASATVLSDNASGAHFDGLDATIGVTQRPTRSGVKIAAPFKAFYGHLDFRLSTDTWNVALTFTVPTAGGISGSTQVVRGKPTAVAFSASYTTPGLAIGDTGAFLQSISGGFTDFPHYSRPRIGLTQRTQVPSTNDARAAECADIDAHYDQYIALNKAFPSYCGQVGTISFDPPLEIDGGVGISAGPVIGKNSALIANGSFRFVDSYFDGTSNVPWAFDVRGGVTMVGLPFNRSSLQVFQTGGFRNPTKFAPVDNSGSSAFLEVHGDGLVEAGGGFDYSFPQSTNYWIFSVNGQAAVALIPKGAAIGAAPPGATAEQYANVVQAHANHWTIAGTITGQVCAQIPKVAKGCATAAAGISNNGVAGCASFSLPGTKALQTIVRGAAKAINALARGGKAAGAKLNSLFKSLGHSASKAASKTKNFFKRVGSGAKSIGNKIGNGFKSAGSKLKHFFHLAADPVATAAANEVIDENIVIPSVNYAIGAVYRWSDGSTHPITTCDHASLLKALASREAARAAVVGVPSAQVVIHSQTTAPRIFVIRGVTAAPDAIVMGPDRRAIRTAGPGFIEPGWIVYKDPAAKTTYVEAVAAPKGRWDFVTAPETSLISSIQTAAGVSIPTVKGGLIGTSGKVYKLAYRVYQPGAGESISLEETDGRRTVQIARLRGTKGTVTYRPSNLLPLPSRVILAVINRGSTAVSVQAVTAINLKQVGQRKAAKKK